MNQSDKLDQELENAIKLREKQSKKIRKIKREKKQKNIQNIGKAVLKKHKAIKDSEDFKENYVVMNKNYKEVLDAFTIIMGIKTDENGQKKLGFRDTEEINKIFNQNLTDEDKEQYIQKIVNHIQKIQNK
ncbi:MULTISPECIES: hypothetical protein [Apilactobacillus]|uniref:Uncharacterized protein n=1 Tax=Apilactobacillus micheneri TaxID=1899430 RepID=A0A9Q8MTM0_9LACO|nr:MULTISPECIES: hypothetical protein [Apilactobacillus]TPR15877.1 hypothetical protein DYZ95_07980 [Apilactobacillus timberlakei]TPR37591.1 hypothetical protein DY119_07455 [Apilactobacillus micheneri]TPR38722.1 hypothetical protein DY121_07285 [Apilactobacillus micheneri]TPR42326.1 hypothetical protein DY124_07690 [Apilactobacillus micheneri]TPR42390.1 hypothetical protein DY130_07285 [Apilactobacillus micheneri]